MIACSKRDWLRDERIVRRDAALYIKTSLAREAFRVFQLTGPSSEASLYRFHICITNAIEAASQILRPCAPLCSPPGATRRTVVTGLTADQAVVLFTSNAASHSSYPPITRRYGVHKTRLWVMHERESDSPVSASIVAFRFCCPFQTALLQGVSDSIAGSVQILDLYLSQLLQTRSVRAMSPAPQTSQ
jgi:hypothetical protein